MAKYEDYLNEELSAPFATVNFLPPVDQDDDEAEDDGSIDPEDSCAL